MTPPSDPLGTGNMSLPDPHNADAGCPPASVWPQVASGTISEEAAMAYLSHAAGCPGCSDLLANALPPDLSDATAEEEAILQRLKTNTPSGRQRLAAVMAEGAQAGRKPRTTAKLLSWPILSVAAAIALAAYIAIPYLRPPSDEQLLAKAYDHNRLSELRIPGSAAVHLASPTRGAGSTPVTSTELLKVKLSAQQKFEQTPNDPALRQTLGEIAIVEHDGETARREFEMAEALNPNLPRLKLDMASAYFELAETKQHPLDYARAIDFYGQYLQEVHRQDPVALFDRGLCWERQSVNSEALKDFEAALALEKNTAWRKEIQRHIDTLKAQSALDNTAAPPLAPASLLTLQSESPGDYENYLDAAGREWLPHRNDPQTQQALQQLAIMGAKHGDLWLHDLLAFPAVSAADAALSQALQASAKGDSDASNVASAAAIQLYQQAHVQPGALRARAEHVYALQRMGRGKDCLAEAAPLLADRQVARYAWMHAYLQLEASSCRGSLGDIAADLTDAQTEVTASAQSNLPIVHLRGAGFVAEDQLALKQVQAAWEAAAAGLRQCYGVRKTYVRQWQFLYVMKRAADSLDLAWTRVGLDEAGALAAKNAGNLQAIAYAFEGLAADETKVGALREAAQNFDTADQTLTRLSPGKTTDEYRVDWKIDRFALRAKESGDLSPILQSIAQSESAYDKLDAFYPRLRYYTEYADVLRRSHRTTQSLQNVWAAIESSERILAGIHTDSARQAWEEQAARSYQILVLDLAAAGQPQDALRAWEWFKGAGNRNSLTPATDSTNAALASLPPIPAQLPGSVTLVYARLEDQYFAWSISPDPTTPIRMRVLSAPAESIDAKGLAFRRLCADPHSSMQDIHILGASLYHDLMEPFADQINQADSIEIDLDHSLTSMPFSALSVGDTPIGVQHPLIFLPDGWSLDSNTADRKSLIADQDTLSGKFKMLVLREIPDPNAAPIPGEYDESKQIASQFQGAKLESAVLWRSGPTLNIAGAPALQADVASADVLHYTGHGLEETKAAPPLGLSTFAVADESTLRCRLAVLAACRTLDQRENIAEDVPSFARLLLQAGAKNVVATQWDVDSRVTQELMVRFYAELTNHQTFAEALRRAQSSIQSDPVAAHPYFWSAFQLIGGPPTAVRGKS